MVDAVSETLMLELLPTNFLVGGAFLPNFSAQVDDESPDPLL